MEFVLANSSEKAKFCVEACALKGVKRIVNKVMNDARLVTNQEFVCQETIDNWSSKENIVFVGTLGESELLANWEEAQLISLDSIRGKREVYAFRFICIGEKKILMIAGSDKRGTIYGAFHLSELMGVSPWIYFADVCPPRKKAVVLTEDMQMISKEPSVKYRGIFINDEWPSFGNWTVEKHGGFTAKMYEHVFELILRLKGNYLWPAMWSSNFSLDGPGLENAILADEMGIVMSNSHHEPCLRHSEEWDLLKGADTPYGVDWNFDKNREGLKEYWRSGLLRNGKFENIITLGMRGERDSEILGHEAGLAENIQYLKDVLTTQNQLIKETISSDLSRVPRMIALYKEVESYYYGDEENPGLKGFEELDGVTLMLCEDNFGNMRYLPNQEERNHSGGYGMYYHFDYHGGPISYEWVNSTCLTKVWEQMTQAFECGISEIWVVNVGDLKPQELPISYFLDLAYDYEKWGINAVNSTQEYTQRWVKAQFGTVFSGKECQRIASLLNKQTQMNHIYKPESVKVDTIHPLRDHLADYYIKECREMIGEAEELLQILEIRNRSFASYYELVYFPVVASMNLLLWNLYGGKNHYYAQLGVKVANHYAELMEECRLRDEELKIIYHSIADGKWNHMMSSEHVGFTNWNDEDARLPLRYLVSATNKPRMVVSSTALEGYSIGTDWTDQHLYIYEMCDPKCNQIQLSIANGGQNAFGYQIHSETEWLEISKTEGTVEEEVLVDISLWKKGREEIFSKEGFAEGQVMVSSAFATVYVHIVVLTDQEFFKQPHLVPFLPENRNKGNSDLKLCLHADDYIKKTPSYKILKPFGKYGSGAKAFPVHVAGKELEARIDYEVYLGIAGAYEISFFFAPSNPLQEGERQRFVYQWNQEEPCIVPIVSEDFIGGDTGCKDWARGVLQNEHSVTVICEGMKGKNQISIMPYDMGIVLEKIQLRKL